MDYDFFYISHIITLTLVFRIPFAALFFKTLIGQIIDSPFC